MTEGIYNFNYDKEYQTFSDTFTFIDKHLTEVAFSGKSKNGAIRNEFVLYYFDGIVIALASLIERINKFNDIPKIINRINEVKFGEELQTYKTGSINGIRGRIRLFTEGVQEILDNK
jgi:hypothetical protein